ncbi:MAG: paraquat-inducible protein A [Alphaproteobacteria bacterium]|nr:paraquat-inducible protein A [Alphaproteobacteria bacterium]
MATSEGRPVRPGGLTVFLLVVGLLTFLPGLVLPALSVRSFWVATSEVAILQGILAFFDKGQAYLGALLLVLSVGLPILKILAGLATVATFAPERGAPLGMIGLLGILSKWSMADVFLMALVVLVLDGQLITTANLRPGAVFFATGVLLSSLGIWRLEALAGAARRSAQGEGA